MSTVGDILSTVGVFSTVGDIMINVGDILSTVGVFSTVGDIMSTMGVILSTVGDVQYRHEYRGGWYHGGIPSTVGGYHDACDITVGGVQYRGGLFPPRYS